MQMILVDETVIDLMPESIGDRHLVVSCASKTAFQKIWGKLTEANLAEVKIMDDGELYQTVEGMHITGTQTHNLPNGTMIGHFYMDGGISQYFVNLDESDEFPEPEDPEDDPGAVQEDEGEPENATEESEGEAE